MISAYILISTQHGKSDEVIKHMRKIDEVVKISAIADEFDIIIRVRVKSLENLHDVTNKIETIEGIEKTITHVIEKEITL